MEKRIALSRPDALRLRVLMRNEQSYSMVERANLMELHHAIDRAAILDPDLMPIDAVTLESRALVRDLDTGECSVYTLVCRARGDLSIGELSVLAPLGTALLGHRAGERVEWISPGGWRRVLIEAVQQSHERPDGPPSPSRERLAA